MSSPFAAFEKLSQPSLIDQLKHTFADLPDARSGTGVYQKYQMLDAALSAFSVFFMQSPSFLAYQRTMQETKGHSNAQSLFGVHQIPSDNQIRNLLDPVSPLTLCPMYRAVLQHLEQQGLLEKFKVLHGTVLVALDGVEYFHSEKIHCAQCSTRTMANGDIHYHHSAVTPVLLSPQQSSVIPLAPEFVTPQDGGDKQDYELAAAKRWLVRENTHLPDDVTVLGDDLYCKQPFCELLRQMNRHFILVCLPASHATLYEWVDDFQRTGQLGVLTKTHWTGKQHLTHRYRFMNHLPLRNTDDALFVNWCELEIVTAEGHQIYHNAFATDYPISADKVEAIVAAGRTRWKIENENNNTLKNQGYHFKHNFGHGKRHLAALLASFNILAYLVHTVLAWCDVCYRLLRQKIVARQTFFNDLRALTRYLCFDSWQHLMEFMLTALEVPLPSTQNLKPGG